MPLDAGNSQATSGMAKAIYDTMDQQLRPALIAAGLEDAKIDTDIVPSWKTLSFAIATGVVGELKGDPAATPDPFFTWLTAFVGAITNAPASTVPAALTAFVAASPIPTNLKGIR